MNRQKTLDWLIKLSKEPGWKAHAWHRAQELDRDDSGLFTGIATELKEHMQKYNDELKKDGG